MDIFLPLKVGNAREAKDESRSMLVPANPARRSDTVPQGGILLNARRSSSVESRQPDFERGSSSPTSSRSASSPATSTSDLSSSLNSFSFGSPSSQNSSIPPKSPTPSLKFAPLPPGKPRSNSISLGVAARANLITGSKSSSSSSSGSDPNFYYSGGPAPHLEESVAVLSDSGPVLKIAEQCIDRS